MSRNRQGRPYKGDPYFTPMGKRLMPAEFDDGNGLDALEGIAARARKSLSFVDSDERLFLAVFDRWAVRQFSR